MLETVPEGSTATPGKPGGDRATIHSIQILRAVAAVLVVLYHAEQAFTGGSTHIARGLQSYLFGFGAVGVHMFFVISGFIMVVTTCRPGQPFSAGTFLKRRFRRIYPIYWLCALAYIALFGLFGDAYQLSAREVVGALLLWPGDASRIIGPGWTLSFEVYFYACFGLAMTLSLLRGLLVLTGLFVVAIVVGVLLPGSDPVWHLVTNGLLMEFMIGAWIGWLAQIDRLPLRFGAAITVVAVLAFAAGLILGYDRVPRVAAWGAPSILLVFGLVTWEARNAVPAGLRRLSRLGDSSYVLYLIHMLVIGMAVTYADAISGLLTMAPLAAALVTLLCVVLAEVIHRRVELPMLALLSLDRTTFARWMQRLRRSGDETWDVPETR